MVLEILTKPEFYDIFGLVAFLIITLIAIRLIKRRKARLWISIILLIIGILGLIIDGYIVYTKFLS